MARRLRWGRVIGAAVVLLVLIAGVCFVLLRGRGKDEKSSSDGGALTNATVADGSNEDNGAVWPAELNGIITEYSGAGSLIGVDRSNDEDGRAVYRLKYKGTSIDSCFDYSRSTLGISGEWTEEITGELYTLSRETEAWVLKLSCEPKGQSGYDLLISVKVK